MNIERVAIEHTTMLKTLTHPVQSSVLESGELQGAFVRLVCSQEPTEDEMRQLYDAGVLNVKVLVESKEKLIVPSQQQPASIYVRDAVKLALGDAPPEALSEYVEHVMNEVGV